MAPTPRDRSYRYCFTWNNYPTHAEETIRAFFDKYNGVYCVVGREKGESGTPHLQGFFSFKNKVAFTSLKRNFPNVHFERAKGSCRQNHTYCTKEGDFFEIGTCPTPAGEAGKAAWSEILTRAEHGDWNWIKEEYPKVWVNFHTKLQSLRLPDTQIINGDSVNEWWYGETGTGKSRLAWEKYGNICYQKMLNKWWDGYDMQPIVVIEEWSPKNEVTASALKIWADRYPFTAQIKGGVLQKIRPTKIIVISNYRLSDCFPDTRDQLPIARRFTEIMFPFGAGEAEKRANDFLASVKQVGEPPSEEALDEDLASSIDDLDLTALIPDKCDDLPLLDQAWVDYATDADFDRLLTHSMA